MMVNTFRLNEAFVRARARHVRWKTKHPDSPRVDGKKLNAVIENFSHIKQGG